MYHLQQRNIAILGRLPLIIADIIVTAITWSTQYRYIRNVHELGSRMTIMAVLMRNGTIYFVVITTLAIFQMALSIQARYGTPHPGDFTPTNLSIFINPLTAMLVSNFLVDLRKAADASAHQQSLSSLGTLEFRMIGELGSITPGPGETGAWEDESSERSSCPD
ncbi:hypothetical protein BV20DRAFT_123300 [Pilatotrama ljubarskyi]|nr:hypothetical protein BV20DRAFT_123300 [Pilatotrama ljubarskyi]